MFWPYAYSDIFHYTFWPHGYEDGYWAYAYDDFFDGVFFGAAGPPAEYVYAPAPATTGSLSSRPTPRATINLCRDPGGGITAWPFAEIERTVRPTAEQKDLLADLRDAAGKAADIFKASCPSDDAFPRTPPGRLNAMVDRLEATLKAVQTVRPPLEAFYDSLTDEQKARFNELGPDQASKNVEASAALPDDASACAEAKPGLTNLPIERIEEEVKPTDAQQDALDRLAEATIRAVGVLQAACPDEAPLTPTGRLQAMEARLKSMIEAANIVGPPLDAFYASLGNEQKARFNRMGQELAKAER